jgi:hypothetical protein
MPLTETVIPFFIASVLLALAIHHLPSAESLRQRLDTTGATGLIPHVFRAAHTMLKQLGVKISACAQGLVPLDVDVSPQDNSNTTKEGVSRTYKNFDGYAPIAAYLGLEGWWTNLERASDEVIGLYRDHATSEQFHSEFKPILIWSACPVVNLPPMRWSWPWVA